jgi:uncharacterized protein with PQ loop repeat
MGTTDTSYDYLMNTATALYLICYIPELYANYKNKNANIWNVPEKILIFFGTGFALTYGVLIKDTAIIINYAPLFGLDTIAMLMRIFYAYKTLQMQRHIVLEDTKSSVEDSRSDGLTSQTTSTDTIQVR